MPDARDASLPVVPAGLTTSAERRHELSRLRQESPIARGPLGLVLLHHQDITRTLRDKRLRGPGMDLARAAGLPEDSPSWARQAEILLFTHGEDHLRLRRLISKAFTPRAVERLRPFAREVIRGLVDQVIDAGRADAISALCRPFPAPIVSELLGLHRWEDVERWAETLLLALGVGAAGHLDEIEEAHEQLGAYVQEVIEDRRRTPGDDLLSRLIAAEQEGDRLTSTELMATVAAVLIAGTDTTSNQLGNMIHTFARHPRAWARLRRSPELVPSAVEEAIRWEPVSESLVRVATEDVEIAGHQIPAGCLVAMSSLSANHDVEAMPGGDRFDITRTCPDGWQLPTFGGGVHHCLGAALARMELAEALDELVTRLPGLRLDGDPVPTPPGAIVTGYASLPIAW